MRGMVKTPRSALALLVPRVGANDVQPAVPPDQLAVLADALDARPYLHGSARPKGIRELFFITRPARGGNTRANHSTRQPARGMRQSSSSAVITSTPRAVTASVCSTWALARPSRV